MRRLMITFLFLSTISVLAQYSSSDNIFYTRFEGVIGNNIQVKANIVRLFDKLSGNYQYRFINEDTEMYYGKIINLNGDVNDEQADLKEMGQESITFTGILRQDSFIGVWNTPDNKQLTFDMKEYYPKGTLPFDIYYLHSEGKLVPDNNNSPIAEIELTLIFPLDEYFQSGIVDSVKQIIAHSFFGDNFYEKNPDSMLTNFETEYFTNYKEQNEDWHSKGASFSWQKNVNMSVAFNSNYLVCLEYLKYAYSGGAHGMSNIAYDIINLNNGTLLAYKDIFQEDTEDSLTSILTHKLRKDYKIPDDIPLKKAGFFVDEIVPNHNIYINGNGIGFVYNSYEIAPYSSGQTNIFLEFDNVVGLLKKDTPVAMIATR